MGQRTAVITGASSGIGKAAAKALVAESWRVIAVGRDPERSAAALAEISAAAANGGVAHMIRADLSRLAEAARAADEIAALTDRVDLLANNAGGMSKAQVMTPEGFEENYAGNHLGPFLLTQRLTPLLQRAAADQPRGAVRIVNTSSDASEMIPGVKFDDLQNLNNWSTGAAYCGAKLANVLHARALAKRLASDGILAFSYHPGTIDSNFISHAGEQTQAYMRTLKFISPEEGADTLLWLALSDPPQSSGGYFYQRAPRTPNPLLEDDEAVERLWRETEKLIARASV